MELLLRNHLPSEEMKTWESRKIWSGKERVRLCPQRVWRAAGRGKEWGREGGFLGAQDRRDACVLSV